MAVEQHRRHRPPAPGEQTRIHNIGYRSLRRPAPGPRLRPPLALLAVPARRLRPRPLGQVQGAADAAVRGDVRARGHHGRRRGRHQGQRPARRVHALRDHHAGRHRPVRRLAGTPVRLPRPALQDRPAVLLAPDRDRRLRPRQVRGAGLGPLHPHRGAAARALRGRAAGQARLRRPDQGIRAGTGLRGAALAALRRHRPGHRGGHPAPRLRHRGRHRRTDHLLRRGLHRSRPSPTSRAAPAPSPWLGLFSPDHAHRRRADRLPGRHLRLPRRGGPAHRRRASSTSSSSSASSPAATAC